MTAKQTFLRERECKGSVRYVLQGGLEVGEKAGPAGVDMSSVVYVNPDGTPVQRGVPSPFMEVFA